MLTGSARPKIGLGITRQLIDIDGTRTLTAPGNVTTACVSGGLLALPSNIGRRQRDRFATVPQVALNVGYRLTDNIQFFVGYSFLYWSNVARPADQINRRVNLTRALHGIFGGAVTGPAEPTGKFRRTDFWTHGPNVGVAVCF